ncbi:hypothetical protein NQ318_021532 [Aromia moschata]|uniref:acid phosphatase n=1 Tax=Aromia moschata TaxID=1265417 RepID=A0AAV8ZDB0_9CUCU|nr:hypothetical protein NQ318_021532 [Aromia moschata]
MRIRKILTDVEPIEDNSNLYDRLGEIGSFRPKRDSAGQLTNVGKRQHYELGQYTRERYQDFLPSLYAREDFLVESTYMDRTYMSAASQLAGLFPPSGDQVWNENIRWQPIPIFPTETAVMSPYDSCTRLSTDVSTVMQTDSYFLSLNEQYQDLFEYLTNYTGDSITSISGAVTIYDTLYIEDRQNFTLPEWTKSVYPEPLKSITDIAFSLYSFTDELKILSTGPFLNAVIEQFEAYLEDSSSARKYLQFSAHDINVASILNTLGAFDPPVAPPFASTIYIEFREINETNYINVYYKSDGDAEPITIAGCDFDCNFDDFKSLVSNRTITPDQWPHQLDIERLSRQAHMEPHERWHELGCSQVKGIHGLETLGKVQKLGKWIPSLSSKADRQHRELYIEHSHKRQWIDADAPAQSVPKPDIHPRKVGKRQHNELGQYTRERYQDFLPARYAREDFLVESTEVDRTYMSAASQLSGLYPPADDQIWNENIRWQPIPVFTADTAVVGTLSDCTRYWVALSSAMSDDYFVSINEEYAELYEYLTNNSGSDVTSVMSAYQIYDTLYIEDRQNFTLPEWTKSVYPEPLNYFNNLVFALFSWTDELKLLTTGPFFSTIIDEFEASLNGSLTRIYRQFSAHDTNVAAILNTLGAFEPYLAPNFASTLYFELREANETNYVNIYYKNYGDPEPITIAGCDFDCKFDDFKSLLSNRTLTPDEWSLLCG